MIVHDGRPVRVAELHAEITQLRIELGETVQALAAKADVKARMRASTADLARRCQGSARAAWLSPRTWLIFATGAAAVAATALVVRGRRG